MYCAATSFLQLDGSLLEEGGLSDTSLFFTSAYHCVDYIGGIW